MSMAKDSIVSSRFNKKRPTPEDARQMAGQATGAGDPKKAAPPAEKRERGRPAAEHDFKPFNTLIDPEQRAKLKYLASMEEKHIYDLVNEALADLLAKYGRQDKYKGLLG